MGILVKSSGSIATLRIGVDLKIMLENPGSLGSECKVPVFKIILSKSPIATILPAHT